MGLRWLLCLCLEKKTPKTCQFPYSEDGSGSGDAAVVGQHFAWSTRCDGDDRAKTLMSQLQLTRFEFELQKCSEGSCAGHGQTRFERHVGQQPVQAQIAEASSGGE
jgi:hypothetical protein